MVQQRSSGEARPSGKAVSAKRKKKAVLQQEGITRREEVGEGGRSSNKTVNVGRDPGQGPFCRGKRKTPATTLTLEEGPTGEC